MGYEQRGKEGGKKSKIMVSEYQNGGELVQSTHLWSYHNKTLVLSTYTNYKVKLK
jgi:hypothetical protein